MRIPPHTGDSFLHLIPHAIAPGHSHSDGHGHNHGHDGDTCSISDAGCTSGESAGEHAHAHPGEAAMQLVLVGILLFFAIQRLAQLVHVGADDNLEQNPKTSNGKDAKGESKPNVNDKAGGGGAWSKSILNLIADAAHNFTDGLAIAASFSASRSLGISTSIAVLLHEVPHEIGDYGILVQNGMTHWQAVNMQILTGVGSLCGACIGLSLGRANDLADDLVAEWVLPITAGGFIYIALVDVTAGLVRRNASALESLAQIGAMLLGIALMALVSILEEGVEV